MAKAFLACEARAEDHPYARRDFDRLVRYAAMDRHKKHAVVNHPDDADLVVFVGSARPNFSDILESKLYRKYVQKSVIFYSGDRAIPILPGVYTCLENRWPGTPRPAALAGFYLRVTDNDSLDINEDIHKSKYLFSFLGNAQNHPVRADICRLDSPRSYVRDSSSDLRQQDDGTIGANRDRGLLYRDVMAQSKFVLCPRGIGVSTWRLFETIRAGRVPVVLSDNWVRPLGPAWDKFCLFFREREVANLPVWLESREHLVESYGAIARREWQTWYSEDNVFNTTIDLLLIAWERQKNENWRSMLATYTQYLQPYFFRYWILSPFKQRVSRRKSAD